MNSFEYKQAYEKVVPSQELIKSTVLKIQKQKRRKSIIISTCFQLAVAACLCIVVGIGASSVDILSATTNNLAGSIFGKGSAWVLSCLIFILLSAVIIVINKRRK